MSGSEKHSHRKDDLEETAKAIQRGKAHRFNQNKKWTKSEEERMLRLRRDGKTWREIGMILHRSRIAVYARNKFIVRRRLMASWSEEEREQRRREYREKNRRGQSDYRARQRANKKESNG